MNLIIRECCPQTCIDYNYTITLPIHMHAMHIHSSSVCVCSYNHIGVDNFFFHLFFQLISCKGRRDVERKGTTSSIIIGLREKQNIFMCLIWLIPA